MEIQTTAQLTAKKCVPCEGGVEPCTREFSIEQLTKLPGWQLSDDGKRIRKDWVLKNFVNSLDFFNQVGQIAETDQHHPDLHLTGYRNVQIEIWTHAIDGLSENDFILAAKIEAIAPVAS
jgi:4a-hydroxytetrahydrobiopterin dehydratase